MKKIKEVSELAGISRRALQYYSDIGLMKNARNEFEYRVYDEEDIERLWRILVCRNLGIKLTDIHDAGSLDGNELKALLERQKIIVESKKQELEKLLRIIKAIEERGMPQADVDSELNFIEHIEKWESEVGGRA
ncbi:MAG: MerR family transcriptional regulator [Mogibacterium sp.]|nr:MerR family transcriptional regulator [Mogibacterium sp.]